MSGDALLAAAEQAPAFAVLPSWWMLYVFDASGGLLAMWHHPNVAMMGAKEDEARALFRGEALTFRRAEYRVAATDAIP